MEMVFAAVEKFPELLRIFFLSLLERERENISESDPSLFLSSGLSIMWEGGEEEEAAKVHQIQPQVP